MQKKFQKIFYIMYLFLIKTQYDVFEVLDNILFPLLMGQGW